MQERTLPYTEGDDAFDAFVAQPDGDKPRPAVIVCHAWGGRGEFAESKAKALADMGYVGAAVDLYGVGKRGDDVPSCQALMMPLLENRPLLQRRLTAAYQTVRTLDGVDPDRIAVIGHCFGGLCAILMARMGMSLRAAVSFHGLLKVGDSLDHDMKARLLVLHGQDDPMVPPSDVGDFTAEMQRIHADWELHVYPRAKHAFANPDANDEKLGTAYDATADRRSWAAMKRLLGETLS